MYIKILILSCVYFICSASNAWAYLDPATGSLILQALVAGGVTALIFFKNLRDKIISIFTVRKKNK